MKITEYLRIWKEEFATLHTAKAPLLYRLKQGSSDEDLTLEVENYDGEIPNDHNSERLQTRPDG